MGKKKLDEILTASAKHSDRYRNFSKTTTQQYFLTPPAIFSIELNAHCLVYLTLLVIERQLPEEVLRIERFHSQSCESVFRSARALSSNAGCGVNFTVLQFFNLIDKLTLFQRIKTQHEQASSLMLRFPLHHKNSHASPSVNLHDQLKLPTRSEIESTVIRAFDKAKDYLEQVGIMPDLRKDGLDDVLALNNFARTLFAEKGILDFFSEENFDNDEDDDEWRAPIMEDDEGDDFHVLHCDEDAASARSTFRTMRVRDQVPDHLLSSYFKVRINEKDKLVHKSTATWVLTDENRKISADRTRRVTEAK